MSECCGLFLKMYQHLYSSLAALCKCLYILYILWNRGMVLNDLKSISRVKVFIESAAQGTIWSVILSTTLIIRCDHRVVVGCGVCEGWQYYHPWNTDMGQVTTATWESRTPLPWDTSLEFLFLALAVSSSKPWTSNVHKNLSTWFITDAWALRSLAGGRIKKKFDWKHLSTFINTSIVLHHREIGWSPVSGDSIAVFTFKTFSWVLKPGHQCRLLVASFCHT